MLQIGVRVPEEEDGEEEVVLDARLALSDNDDEGAICYVGRGIILFVRLLGCADLLLIPSRDRSPAPEKPRRGAERSLRCCVRAPRTAGYTHTLLPSIDGALEEVRYGSAVPRPVIFYWKGATIKLCVSSFVILTTTDHRVCCASRRPVQNVPRDARDRVSAGKPHAGRFKFTTGPGPGSRACKYLTL